MIKVLDTDDYRAFLSAKRNPPTQKVIKILGEELENVRKANDVLEGRELTLSQGKAQLLNELLEIFKDAESLAAPSEVDGITGRGTPFY